MKTSEKLNFTAVLVQDPYDKGYTAFFEEFPQAIAEGDTDQQALTNLKRAMMVMMEFNKEDVEDSIMPDINKFGNVRKQNVELEFAIA